MTAKEKLWLANAGKLVHGEIVLLVPHNPTKVSGSVRYLESDLNG